MNVSEVAVTSMVSAAGTLLNGGTLVIYSGTQPATPETALSGNTALATFTFAATAMGAPAASGGFMQGTLAFTATSVAPSASGTATFARAFESNGTTALYDFSVGTSGTDIIIGNTAIQTGVDVTVSSAILQMPYS